MRLLDKKIPHRIVPTIEGNQIRSKDDVYVAEHTDEEGNIVP